MYLCNLFLTLIYFSYIFLGANPSVFASSSAQSTRDDNVNGTTYFIFAGYNPIESDNGIHRLVSFTLLDDWCSIISDVDSCLVANGCQWCGSHDNNTSSINNNTGFCVKTDATHQCNTTIQTSNTTTTTTTTTSYSECSVNEVETRDCSSFTSCSTCRSDFGGNSQRCKWCRCKVCEIFFCEIFFCVRTLHV